MVFTSLSPAENDKSPAFLDFQIAAERSGIIVDSTQANDALLHALTGFYTSYNIQKNAVPFSNT